MDISYEEGSTNQTENCSTPFSSQEYTNVAIVKTVVSCISLISSVFVIALIAFLKLWKFFSQRLILYLTITATVFSVANIFNSVDYNGATSSFLAGFCVFSGFLTQVSAWMILNCMTSITIYIFLRTVANINTERYEFAYVIATFVVPFIFNWIPFINNSYGKSGVWCWIAAFDLDTCEGKVFGRWLQFGLYYFPLYTLVSVLLILYSIIGVTICHKRQKLGGTDNPNTNKVVKKKLSEVASLIAYPLIYFVLNIPLLINRLYTTTHPTEPSLALWYLAGVALPLIGALTGVVFTFTTVISKKFTWADFRARARGKMIKATEYPMKPQEISDSMSHPYCTYKSTPQQEN